MEESVMVTYEIWMSQPKAGYDQSGFEVMAISAEDLKKEDNKIKDYFYGTQEKFQKLGEVEMTGDTGYFPEYFSIKPKGG